MLKTKLLSIFFYILLIGCKSRHIDYWPLEKLNLNKDCAVYFTRLEGEQGDFEQEYGDCIVTDKSALEKLKTCWTFTKTDKRMPCGFGYQISVIQDKKVIEQIHLNSACDYAVTESGWYEFDESYFDCIDKKSVRQLNHLQVDSIWKELSKNNNGDSIIRRIDK